MDQQQTKALLEGVGSALDAFGSLYASSTPAGIAHAFAADAEELRAQWSAVVQDLARAVERETVQRRIAESLVAPLTAAIFEKLACHIGEEVAKAATATVVEKLRERARFDEAQLSSIADAVRARVAQRVTEGAREALARRAANR
jgi:hypothetical protein